MQSNATVTLERPIFLDESGRRGRVVRIATRLVAVLMAAWLVAVIVGALTPLQLPTLPRSLASTQAAARHQRTTSANDVHFTRLTSTPTVGSRFVSLRDRIDSSSS
jgi:hypothetical protein